MDDGYRRGLGTRRYALGGKGIWSRELGQRVQFVRELFSRSPKPPPCPTTGSKVQTWTGEANLASQWESQALSLARIWPSGVLGLCRSSRQSEGCVSLSFRPSPQNMAMAQLEGAPRVPSISQAVATVCFLFERRLNVDSAHESTRRPLATLVVHPLGGAAETTQTLMTYAVQEHLLPRALWSWLALSQG